jgi:hypothetical protein
MSSLCDSKRNNRSWLSPVNYTFMMVRKTGSKKEKKTGTNSQFHQQLWSICCNLYVLFRKWRYMLISQKYFLTDADTKWKAHQRRPFNLQVSANISTLHGITVQLCNKLIYATASEKQFQNERNIRWLMKVSMVLPHEWLQNSPYDRETRHEVTTTTTGWLGSK